MKLERFPAKWTPVSRKKNASRQEARAPFRFNRNGKGSSAGVQRISLSASEKNSGPPKIA